MDGLILEPYSARLQLNAPEELPHVQWATVLTDLFDNLAARCDQTGATVIGHIKALARFPRGRFFRISVVAAEYPATIEGSPPARYRQLELTLNVIVYGLARNQLAKILKSAIAETITELEVRLFEKPAEFPLHTA